MPKSNVRKKKVYTPPSDVRPSVTTASKKASPTWVPATAASLLVFGIAWLVAFYLSGGAFPVLAWGYWNLGVGFGAMVASLAVFSRWR